MSIIKENTKVSNIFCGSTKLYSLYVGKEKIFSNKSNAISKINFIEYLENTDNGQYIDTGFQPNQDTTLIIQLMPNTNNNYGAIAGARSSLVSFCLFNNVGTYRADYNNKNTKGTIELDITSKAILKLDKNKFYVNDELINEFVYVDFETGKNLYLFNVNSNGSTMSSIKYKMYSAKIYDNDILIRDFKPCKDDNEVDCLYETTEDKYYYLDGTSIDA